MIMKKMDLILIAAILAAAGLFYIFFSGQKSGGGSTVIARSDGKEIGRWSLSEEIEADLDTVYGHNRIQISGGEVRMTEADCPDGYCMQQSAVTASGGSIICLPHRLIIETADEEGNEVLYDGVDTVAK